MSDGAKLIAEVVNRPVDEYPSWAADQRLLQDRGFDVRVVRELTSMPGGSAAHYRS